MTILAERLEYHYPDYPSPERPNLPEGNSYHSQQPVSSDITPELIRSLRGAILSEEQHAQYRKELHALDPADGGEVVIPQRCHEEWAGTSDAFKAVMARTRISTSLRYHTEALETCASLFPDALPPNMVLDGVEITELGELRGRAHRLTNGFNILDTYLADVQERLEHEEELRHAEQLLRAEYAREGTLRVGDTTIACARWATDERPVVSVEGDKVASTDPEGEVPYLLRNDLETRRQIKNEVGSNSRWNWREKLAAIAPAFRRRVGQHSVQRLERTVDEVVEKPKRPGHRLRVAAYVGVIAAAATATVAAGIGLGAQIVDAHSHKPHVNVSVQPQQPISIETQTHVTRLPVEPESSDSLPGTNTQPGDVVIVPEGGGMAWAIGKYASDHNRTLTSEQAYQVYTKLRKLLGAGNIMDRTYTAENDEERIQGPGEHRWSQAARGTLPKLINDVK